jgi:hypothetical protein
MENEVIDTKSVAIYTCSYCDKTFLNKYTLKNHLESAKYCLKLRGSKAIKSIECRYCKTHFSQKIGLIKHNEICGGKILAENKVYIEKRKEELKLNIQSKEEEINEEKSQNKILTQKINNLEQKISELEKRIEQEKIKSNKLELELACDEGRIKELTKIKPSKNITNNNNTYINSKVANLPIENIEPLTINYVRDNAYDNYTIEEFKKGKRGLVDFIISIIVYDPMTDISSYTESSEEENNTKIIIPFVLDRSAPNPYLDPKIELNYPCTDISRDKFHLLGDKKIWKEDAGASFLRTIFDVIRPLVIDYNKELTDEFTSLEMHCQGSASALHSDEQAHLSNLLLKLSFLYSGLYSKDGSVSREKLFNYVKNAIKNIVKI